MLVDGDFVILDIFCQFEPFHGPGIVPFHFQSLYERIYFYFHVVEVVGSRISPEEQL
jgi:hypothetical protein